MAAKSIEELPPVLEAQRNRMKVHEGEIDEESRYVQSRYFKDRPLNEMNLHCRMLESSFKSFVEEHKSMISLIPPSCSQFLKKEQNSYAVYRQKYMATLLVFEVEIKRREFSVIQQGRNRPRDTLNSRYHSRRDEIVTGGQWDLDRMARNDGYSPSNDSQELLSLDQRSQMRIRSVEQRSQNFDRSRLGAQLDSMSTSSAGNTDDDVLDLYADDEMMDFAVSQPLSSSRPMVVKATTSEVYEKNSNNRLKSAVVVRNERVLTDVPIDLKGHEIADEQMQPNGCRCCKVAGHSLTKFQFSFFAVAESSRPFSIDSSVETLY